MNENVFRYLSYGVYVVGTMDDKRPVGCVANCAMQITVQPPTIAISINHENYTNHCIEETGKFSLCILSEKADPALIGVFGYTSSKENDKFLNVSYELKDEVPVLKESCGYLICKVIDKLETSTHTVFLGEITDGDTFNESEKEMTYSYYHTVLKGKTPKNAPTYRAEESTPDSTEVGTETKTGKYVCTVCGYEYIGETLPPDYICPICRKGADKFKKVE